MARNRIPTLRAHAFHRQNGLCCYCGLPMWGSSPLELITTCGLTPREAASRQCTAEHLVARSDGGRNSADNIAAACLWCNQRRHQRKRAPRPADYERYVERRVSSGKWLSREMLAKLASRRKDVPLSSAEAGRLRREARSRTEQCRDIVEPGRSEITSSRV